MPAILVIDDEAILAKNIKAFLERHGFEVRVADSAEGGLRAIDEFVPDALLIDYNLPGMDGLQLLGEIRRRDPQVRVVMLTGHGSTEVAVQAMKAGATDYLSKPVALSELKLVLERTLNLNRLEGALAYYREREAVTSGVDRLIGASAAMTALKQTLRQLIDAEKKMVDGAAPAVLVTGETGTGKELVARALHYDGARRARPFVEVNCASIPSTLLESELFGYERGAFTDARQRKLGLLEAADGGTMFLDEISEIDLPTQAKLLKLLEDRRIRRLGGLREQEINVRFIAASNRDLEQMTRDGRFRADLFFRLRIVHMVVPSLRERDGDVLMLATHFLALHGARYGRPKLRLSEAAKVALQSYNWPGNVRELRNAVEQAVLLARDDVIDAAQFPACASRPAAAMTSTGATTPTEPKAQASAEPAMKLGEVERELLVQALTRTAWNVTRAAQLLGITRDTLRYRMEKYRVRPPA